MGYVFLGLSVACSIVLGVIFKEINRFRLNLLQVICWNYIACVGVGAFLSPDSIQNILHTTPNPLPLALIEGALFIGMFVLIGYITQWIGLGYVALLTRMSVVIPILVSFVVYDEFIGIWKGAGIFLALAAVWLINHGKLDKGKAGMPLWKIGTLAVIAFIGSGTVDTLLKVYQTSYTSPEGGENDFLVFLFGTAAALGILLVTFQVLTGKAPFSWRNFPAGLLLGIANYFSAFFVIKALNFFEGPTFFPVNNVSVLLLATLVGIFVYGEKYNARNRMGLVFAVAAIGMILLSNLQQT
ncbi:MAG: EamA/RhaT family transporter [Bacteroidota bacterium]